MAHAYSCDPLELIAEEMGIDTSNFDRNKVIGVEHPGYTCDEYGNLIQCDGKGDPVGYYEGPGQSW